MAESSEVDVVVVGGGPAGAATAIHLARRGRRVVVLERDTFPRFHIGESQLPWSSEVLQALGVDAAIASAGFVQKWGATFIASDGRCEQYADFADAPEVPRPQTYQVTRAAFDEILLTHAANTGAEVLAGAQAVDVQFTATDVTVGYIRGGVRRDVRAAAIVDASGRSGFIARRFGERRYDAVLRNVALHGQYEGIPRRDGRRSGDIRMVTRSDRGWFWFIPLTETVTSVGVVVPKNAYNPTPGETLAGTLERALNETPAARALTATARLVSPVRFDADYSYESACFAGDRWVSVGDAGAFLDPIFSTGVLLAIQSGLEAATSLDAGLRSGALSRRCFRRFERTVRRRYRHFRRFAVGFYDPAFRDLFFSSGDPFGVRDAVVSVLAGNWRPTVRTRLRIMIFFALVGLQRRVRIAPRLDDPR